MAVVHIPALLRPLTGGLERCEVAAGTVRELILQLDALHPGVRDRLLEGDSLRSGLSVFVDGTARREALDYELEPDSEVYFVPAIAGGAGLSRREVLALAVGAAGALAQTKRFDQRSLAEAPARVVAAAGASTAQIEVVRRWTGAECRSTVVNRGREPAPIKEVVLFDLTLPLPPETRIYGEGFQMLSQTGGTISAPADLGNYTDAAHYRLPAPAGSRALYGLLTLSPPGGEHHLVGFTSCRRFSGQFYLEGARLQVAVDTEGLALAPGESWDLEELTFRSGPDRDDLLEQLARRMNENHPPLRFPAPPAGWCSWYCFGPRVTTEQVRANLDFIARRAPGLKYIQIDDGYQAAMGDWLDTGAAFGGDVRRVLREIRERGFEPAIWVAPFVAEQKSRVFSEHPEWFMRDAEGKPLRSDSVTFGGWRRGPWYALDGTHPEAQRHLETVFRTMRRDWGCTYFKLDANFWGAMHGGRLHDARATRIEAYRRGMQAILRGAGDSFILGCNHPIWASLGLIHGSRSSNDIKRSWDRIATTARQNLSRNWQNGRLWWNDPDAVVLTGTVDDSEARFHSTAILASGGMVLSGDDLTGIAPDRLAMLEKLLPASGVAARFAGDSLQVGRIRSGARTLVCVLNWDDASRTIAFDLPRAAAATDYWTGEKLGKKEGTVTLENVPARSGRVLVCE